jgi:hypothetical protein
MLPHALEEGEALLMNQLVAKSRRSFFWGAPSHRPIAWVGATSGLGVVALAVFLLAIGHGAPLFVVALLCEGLANLGWGAELLPRQQTSIAGWARVARCTLAVAGTILALVSLLAGVAFSPAFGIVIVAAGILQIFEFAPGGPSNRP